MSQMLQQPLYPKALIVDLYELTMAAGYFENHYNHLSTFELFVREMPVNRSFLVAAGLQQAVEYLINLSFTDPDIDYLRRQPTFKQVHDDFWDYLKEFNFSGDIWAVPEGSIVFPGEPLIRVTAPMIEAQIVETYLLSIFNFQTLIASKAARVVQASRCDGRERLVMEFGSRRAHGPEASILAARASFIAGCGGTSNVFAGMRYDIPIFGTAAHSWTMAFGSEPEAFAAYYKVFPDSTILLVDTYDIAEGARNAVKIGEHLKGVRIDSGDLLVESRKVRKILDDAGLSQVSIVVSGDLNEEKITRLVEQGAPVDSFGVGTQMSTSADAPSLGGIYKLVEQEIDGATRYRAKFSENKSTYPAKKQIYRLVDKNGLFQKDIVGIENDAISGSARILLQPVMKAGRAIADFPGIRQIQDTFFNNLSQLPEVYKKLHSPQIYPVEYSPALQSLFDNLKKEELE